MLYDAMAYGHLEAEASVAHGSPTVDGSNCSILHADIPTRHCHVHGYDHERMSDHVLVSGCSVRPALVKVEAWRVELAPVDSEKLLGLGLFDRHDLANSNVHGWASILYSPLCLDVVEWQYRLMLPCQPQRTSFLCRQGGIGPV